VTLTALLWNGKAWTNLRDIVLSEQPHAEKKKKLSPEGLRVTMTAC